MRTGGVASASLIVITLCFTAGCAREKYGFVARLGNDTMSVERITRTRDRVVSDVVEHAPHVIRRHWEAQLNTDGTVKSWRMEVFIPNPGPGEIGRTEYTAEFAADSVRATIGSGNDRRRFAIKSAAGITVPWLSFDYGTYELIFAAALKHPGDTVPINQYQPGFEQFGHGVVRKQPGDSVTFVTTGLAGTGVGHMDAQGRMLSYSGAHTTYKQEVQRVQGEPDIDAITDRFATIEERQPVKNLSVRDTTRATVGNALIMIDYSRPLTRGRVILGGVVPYGMIWRTGANAATQLSTSAPITIAGMKLDSGIYTVWTLPRRDSVLLIINRQAGQWGTQYNPARDLGRARLRTAMLAEAVHMFTISVDSIRGRDATLVMEWDRFRWSAPIVSTK